MIRSVTVAVVKDYTKLSSKIAQVRVNEGIYDLFQTGTREIVFYKRNLLVTYRLYVEMIEWTENDVMVWL